MLYFFILGRNPQLSFAELHAVLPSGYHPLAYAVQVLIVECAELDTDLFMKKLGGTTKMGGLFRPLSSLQGREAAVAISEIASHTLAMTDLKDKKVFFGLSAYALNPHAKLPDVRELRGLGIEAKRALQKQGYKARLVTSKEVALSSVIVKKEKLLTQGAEIVLLYTKDGISFGKTIAVQEFEEASARDFGRPERAMKVGMLPIQLTKIMLNLAHAKMNATILDPFCGLGTVLTEALQMGYANLIGTDLEQKMIDATRQNLEWLTKHNKPFSDSGETENVKLFVSPVEQLSEHLPPQSVDAIVTEPYMGPTQRISNFQLLISNIVALYINAFREFTKILKPGGRVVFIFPTFKTGTQLTKTSDRVLPEIKKLSFTPITLLPQHITVNRELKSVNSITYSRPDQRVLREIFVLEFKP